MSANFAHMILAETLSKQADSIPNMEPTMVMALQNYTSFCKLGAVSPDCPSVVGETDATGFGNMMHYLRPADFVRFAVPKIHEMNFSLAETRCCLAWIFGYASHLVTDLTIHPVISRKFGAYAASKKNRQQHRLCEFNQDVYLYHRTYAQEIVGADFLKFSGLAECAVNGNINKLNPAIISLWSHCLQQFPRSETKSYVRLPNTSLRPTNWYATYTFLFKSVVTKGNAFLEGIGFGYPRIAELKSIYLEDLPTDSGRKITYNDLVAITKTNIKTTWATLASALGTGNASLFTLPNANLDTGLTDITKKPVFPI
jgi:hypothetical protein